MKRYRLVMMWPLEPHEDRQVVLAEARTRIETIATEHDVRITRGRYDFIGPDSTIGRQGWALAFTGTAIADAADDQLPLDLEQQERRDILAECQHAEQLSRIGGIVVSYDGHDWKIGLPSNDPFAAAPLADDDPPMLALVAEAVSA